eukprot:m.10440 g.10440  ORF g.10440 m.10440 type:complete len:333 (-) comp2526_c0_seq1:138-1136(-)
MRCDKRLRSWRRSWSSAWSGIAARTSCSSCSNLGKSGTRASSPLRARPSSRRSTTTRSWRCSCRARATARCGWRRSLGCPARRPGMPDGKKAYLPVSATSKHTYYYFLLLLGDCREPGSQEGEAQAIGRLRDQVASLLSPDKGKHGDSMRYAGPSSGAASGLGSSRGKLSEPPPRSVSRETLREPYREPLREPHREPLREPIRELHREPPREPYHEGARDPPAPAGTPPDAGTVSSEQWTPPQARRSPGTLTSTPRAEPMPFARADRDVHHTAESVLHARTRRVEVAPRPATAEPRQAEQSDAKDPLATRLQQLLAVSRQMLSDTGRPSGAS